MESSNGRMNGTYLLDPPFGLVAPLDVVITDGSTGASIADRRVWILVGEGYSVVEAVIRDREAVQV
jgi:hypothetical protein